MYFINYKILRRKLYVSSIDDGSSKPEDINEEANRAVQWYLENRTPIFITGSAGTGKSHLIKRIYNLNKNKIAVTASTGIASMNLGDFACTIHKLLGLRINWYENLPPCYEIKKVKRKIEKIETIIDEVSMLSSKTIDQIDKALRYLTGISEPFGNKQVIFFGDLYQLPPVVDGINDNELKKFLFYNVRVFKKNPLNTIVLKKNYRQKDDEVFLNLLDVIKQPIIDSNEINPELHKTIEYINNRCQINEVINNEEEKELVLTSFNEDRININNKEISKIEQKLNTQAIIEEPILKDSYGILVKGNEKLKKDILKEFKDNFDDEELKIITGAKIMFTRNTDEFANGTLGVILDIKENYLKVQLKNGNKIKVTRSEYIIELSEVEYMVYKYPIRLAWAITVHKSQGLTLDSYKINIGKSFCHGLTYVALSRATSFDSIKLVNPLKAHEVSKTFLTNIQEINKDKEYFFLQKMNVNVVKITFLHTSKIDMVNQYFTLDIKLTHTLTTILN